MGDIWEARREAGVDVWRESEPEAGCVFDGLLVGEAPGTVVESRAIVVRLLWSKSGERWCLD